MPQATDYFGMIRNAYGVPAKKGGRVKYRTKTGTITKSDGQYIWILLDGETKASGPYHPTYDITYLEAQHA